jgi:hypothetical protein
MKPQEKILFCKLLAGIAEFYGKPLSRNVLEIYWNILEKYSLDQIKHALNLHIVNPDHGQFMPKPADIIRYLEVDDSIKALHAWDKVISAIRRVGSNSSITFDDPLINVVIHQMGGWINLCYQNEDKMPFIANEFRKRYAVYLIHPSPTPPAYLPGIDECTNRLNGYDKHIEKPVLFGEKDMKLLISNAKPENEDKDHE